MISGFMVIKDVIKQGYPFVEALASVLPLCDEFFLAEGYSTDGTYEVAKKIAALNSKVKLIRQEWPAKKSMAIIGQVTNELRRKCAGTYIFSIQANEVIHERSLDYLKALPEMYPEVQTFSLPFLHLLWNYKYYEEYRLRFAKNHPGIIAIGDAWALGPSKSFIRYEARKSLKNPRQLFRYIGRGIEWTYANSCITPNSRAVYPPTPVFRYWALFPHNYIQKCEKHKELFGLQEFDRKINILKNHVDNPPESFWKTASDIAKTDRLGVTYPENMRTIETKEHPKIMQEFIYSNNLKSYYVRNEILDTIKDL